MGLYERFVLPRVLDFAMRQEPIMRQRAKVVPRAAGRVLEIGIGSGLNLAFYDRSRVDSLVGLDPSPELRAIAERRAREAGIDVEWIPLGGESIPLDEASVDTVLTTYTLCTIPAVERALGEMRRVLRPGGRLLFSEHGRAPDPGVKRWQDRLNPLWNRIGGGCNLNRPVEEMVRRGGFEPEAIEALYLPGPRPLTYTTWGSALRA
ncbi:methyltransferase domain-containing protein [bacterium]|nr:methyltransferase domain-containing protein [bacterium]